jgi:hypothetical protein
LISRSGTSTVLLDEFHASTMGVPWPDVLQRLHMANPLSLIARRFSADMVIINFVAADLARR